jgi:hypothetical protein
VEVAVSEPAYSSIGALSHEQLIADVEKSVENIWHPDAVLEMLRRYRMLVDNQMMPDPNVCAIQVAPLLEDVGRALEKAHALLRQVR